MARQKLSKIASELNVGLNTVREYLQKKNIEVEEGVNARVDEEICQLLIKEFGGGKEINLGSKPKPAAPAPQPSAAAAAVEPAAPKTENGPKVLGKIDLATGKPVVEPKPEVKPEPEVKPGPKPEVEAEPKAEPKPEPKPEVKSEVKVEVRAEPKAEAKPDSKPEVKPEPKPEPKAEVKPEPKPEPKAEVKPEPKPEPKPEVKPEPKAEVKPEPKPEPEKQEAPTEPEVFRMHSAEDIKARGPQLNVVGKIDLSAINGATRPKKKSKEERRNDREGDRKKRKRIGAGEKVDVQKEGRNAGRDNKQERGGGNGGNQQSNKSKKENKDRNRKAKQASAPEVSEEDVQKQVKEVLARLTSKGTKGQKVAAKWRKEKREAFANREHERQEQQEAESKILKLTEFVTANDLASLMNVPINNVIATCMQMGVMVSINQRLDAETINIVAEEFGFQTEYITTELSEAVAAVEDSEEDLLPRPPIVTVMGHVDHGKTSLLDYIRQANVIAGEAGGITQHIGAYHVTLSDGRKITFLDTPGHEAFTAMRARGAKVTDLVIIIVAADDAVMPQTVEAINHAAAAGVPIVFAINKIDKPHANPDKIKEELSAMNYLVEDWGGKYQSQDISAKKGIGVEELMEKVLLEAEMLDLKANPNRNAVGAVLESSLDKGRGYVATVLVQSGTLKVGDIILAGTHYGKVKAMFNERNQKVNEAGPAVPVLILGLNGAPTAGDTFNVLDSEQEAREIATKREQLQREQSARTTKMITLEDIGRRRAIGNFQELNIIVKGDVDGSIEALSDSLLKLSTEEIQINVIHKAVGAISESDVDLAAASDAIIVGFQVRPSQTARKAAEREGVDIRLYSVIYQAIEEVKDAMAGMLAPELKEEITGTAEVLQTYHISKVGTIAGAIVREGKIKRSNKVRLIRDGIVRYTGDLGSLKRFKDDVKEVALGYDCGLSIAGYNDLQVGDIIEGFEEVEVSRTI
ncbi:MAG: translation initiation factor IF-2 [Bacteroides sp.]|nr:translation initiation factor IF-2 [Bacteroides sp.]MCM1380235.1 translation initiation factor IF-2 [Bacteroides sp.]MCM1446543.1 translation initiation factor IF-2 [Prevotella sp.]